MANRAFRMPARPLYNCLLPDIQIPAAFRYDSTHTHGAGSKPSARSAFWGADPRHASLKRTSGM